MTPDRIPADDVARRLADLEGDGLDGTTPTAEEIAAARLTAHALGELAAPEAEEVERALADPAARPERDAVAETRDLGRRLRAAALATGQGAGPTGSPALRTAVTAALATRDVPRPAPAPRGRGRSRSVLALMATGGTAAALMLTLAFTREGLERPPFGPRPESRDRVAPPPAVVAQAEMPAAPAAAATKAIPAEAAGRLAATPLAEGSGPAPSAVATPDQGRESDATPDRFGAALAATPEAAEAKSLTEALAQSDGAALSAASPLPHGGPPGMSGTPAMGRGVTAPGALPLAKAEGQGQGGPRRPAAGDARSAESRFGVDASAAAAAGPGSLDSPEADPSGRRWFHERDRHAFIPGAPGSERYARFVENSFRDPSDEAQARSTFAIDVDTASYALVRRFLNDRQVPPPDAVRLEEMLNYFRYDDPAPAGDDPLAVRLESAACPWQPGHRLLRVALKGRDVAAAARPGTSLVFLVDVSGSMDEPNKLPLVKQSLAMLVEQLTENDKVAIVTYAGDAGVRLPPTSGDQKARIRAAIDSLAAGGSTNGSAGIEIAYRLAREAFVKGGSNRVLLATDGDLNVGITDDAALVGLIREKAASGVFLTVLGFGRGNLQDEKMEKLADNGNGIYAYVDGAREARKVLVEQLTGSTLSIAKDVKIQITFNPARVAAYRLLGYENRLLAARDFKDDTKDGGEVGAGHGVTALYEIVPVAEAGQGPTDDPIEYRPVREKAERAPASPDLCTVKFRWKTPEGSESVERVVRHEDAGGTFEAASTDLRFAAAVAEFGMLLRESRHRGRASLEHVASTASGALGTDPGGLRAEFLDIVREAGALLPYERRGTPN